MIYKMYRIENWLYKIKLTFFAKIVRAIIRILFSCDIPYKAYIGKGTSFPHLGLSVLINPNAIIGENCKILQGVSIGWKSGHKKVPVIGNNVLIGAHALILGPVTIGDNVIIGAGAVVIEDVPANSVVVGNPARIIKKVGKNDKSIACSK